jgi:hypothetical protein
MDKVAIIGPHLQAILQSIARPHNSAYLSDNQYAMLRVNLMGFKHKLERLGVRFEVHDPESKFEIHGFLEALQEGILKVVERINDGLAIPTFNCKLADQRHNPPESELNYIKLCMSEIQSSLLVNAPVQLLSFGDDYVLESTYNLIEDSLLALSRVRPSRILSLSGSLCIRDVTSYQLICNEAELTEINNISQLYYHIISRKMNKVGDKGVKHFIVELIPKYRYMNDVISQSLYGRNLDKLSMGDILNWDDDYAFDHNFSPLSIYNKLIGSSISSLDFVMQLYTLIGGSVYEVDYPGEGVRRFRERFCDKGLSDIYNIVSPDLIRENMKENKLTVGVLKDVYNHIFDEIKMLKLMIFSMGKFHNFVHKLFDGENVSHISFYKYGGKPRPSAPNGTLAIME